MTFGRTAGRHHVRTKRTTRAWFTGTLIGTCAVAIAVLIVTAVRDTPVVTPAPATTTPQRQDPTSTPQARAFLAEIYRKGVGPNVLDARGAVPVATAVCAQNSTGKVGLATLAQNVGVMIPKLTRIQAAELVDDAIKYYCPGR